MRRKNENIDSLFKDSLKDYSALPDEAVWERISEKLSGKRKFSTLFIVTRIAAGVALVTALGFVLRIILTDPERGRPAYENIVLSDQTDTGQPEQHASPAPSYRDNEREQGITRIPADDTGLETDPIPVDPEKAEQETVAMPVDPTQADQPGNRVQADTDVLQTNAIPEDRTDQTVLADQTALNGMRTVEKDAYMSSPLQWIARRETSMLPVLDEKVMINIQQVVKQRETDIQTGIKMAYESEGISPVNSGKSWVMGGELAPLYSYRHLASDDLDNSQLIELNDVENGIIAYAGGIHVTYEATRRFSIQSGLYYSRYGQEKEVVAQYRSANSDLDQVEQSFAGLAAVSITNSTGVITNSRSANSSNDYLVISSGTSFAYDNLEGISAVQYFDYLEFPLIFRYKLIDRRMDFRLAGGLLTSLLVGNQVYLKQDNDAKYYGETINVRSVNYVGTVGLGIEYPFSENLKINFEPRFGYYLKSIDITSEIKVHPYSFGIFTGVSFRF